MTFSLHDSIGPDTCAESSEPGFPTLSRTAEKTKQDMHILEYKIKTPDSGILVERTRIDSLLARSVSQFPATLVSGRAGTGKTAVAEHFSAKFNKVAWYSVESTDTSWPVFSNYFSASLHGSDDPMCQQKNARVDVDQGEIAKFLLRNFTGLCGANAREKTLIVLDDVHHVFDSPWFDNFFNLLILSLPAYTHLLLLCRSKPPSPLWRLRSKQMLNVLDEKVIAFNASETEALLESMALPASRAKDIQRQAFGRVSKILQLSEDQCSNLPAPLV